MTGPVVVVGMLLVGDEAPVDINAPAPRSLEFKKRAIEPPQEAVTNGVSPKPGSEAFPVSLVDTEW